MKILSLALIALPIAFFQGCSGAPTDEAPTGGEETTETSQPARVLDEIKIGADTTVRLEEGPQGGIVVVGSGPRNSEALANQALEQAESVEALYAAAKRQIPAVVQEALDKFDNGGSFVEPNGVGVAKDPLLIAENVDELAVVEKEAPRNVTWFRNTFCTGDHMDEYAVAGSWWRRNEWCQTERTNNFTRNFYSVRQGFVSVHMYRGNATIRYQWQTTGGWVVGPSYAVNEGNYQWVRVTIPSQMNLSFELLNASGDGYNYSIHAANSNMRAMLGVDGQDYYHILCTCDDGFNWANIIVEQCLNNPTSSSNLNTINEAKIQCNRLYEDNDSFLESCGYRAVERRTVGMGCRAEPFMEPYKNCNQGQCRF